MKFLEVTATFDCLEVLAGRPYEGDDWDGYNALLCCTFMESVPPSIYFKIRCRTAYENFKYLAKRFHDNDQIPCANELQRAGTATAMETPDNCPTSADAATERHVHTEWNTEDLSTTQDVDNGNVRRMEDPCTSFEASVQGTSAKCAEMTPVVLEGTLHELQTEPQSSLPLTPRPPIDGEPCVCKQEAVDSVVTAGCTNGTVQLAELTEIMDVDLEKAALDSRDLVERVHIVDEGGEERKSPLRLPKIEFYCTEKDQRNANANAIVPSAYGVPLEGEWAVCASGNSGCGGGTSGFTSVDEAEAVEPADTPNESEELVTLSIQLEGPDGGDIPRMYLGSTRMQTGDAKDSRGRMDVSSGQADDPRAWTDTLNVSNSAETDVIGHGKGVSTYLGTGDPKCLIHETDGIRGHADMSTGQMHAPSIETKAIIPVNTVENVRTTRKKKKPPDLPMEVARCAPGESDGLRDHMDRSSVHTDAHWVGNERQTAEDETEIVSTWQNSPKTQDSPYTLETKPSKHSIKWSRVSVGNGDVYVPMNVPIAAPSQIFVFG